MTVRSPLPDPSALSGKSHRRSLMATAGGKLVVLPFDPPSDLPSGLDAPASLGQFLVIERAKERQRIALARQRDAALQSAAAAPSGP